MKTQTDTAPFDPLMLPTTKLLLYPLLARQKNPRDYSLLRLGCRTVTVLSTTHAGILAWRLLKRGYTAGEVSARLGSKFRCNGADIQPLLKALLAARMIRSINGQTVEEEIPSFKRQLQQRLEWASKPRNGGGWSGVH